MAEIKMSCIFIEKQKHELKEMQEILLEVIDDAVQGIVKPMVDVYNSGVAPLSA